MSLLLMTSSGYNTSKAKQSKKHLKDNGTCQNCKHQGNCPYANGVCSRAYYHKIYSDKKEKSVDKFKLK
jgi:hypothetical protein